MLAVWCQVDELSICPETFRPFILRSPVILLSSSSRTIFLRVSQFGVALVELDFFQLTEPTSLALAAPPKSLNRRGTHWQNQSFLINRTNFSLARCAPKSLNRRGTFMIGSVMVMVMMVSLSTESMPYFIVFIRETLILQ